MLDVDCDIVGGDWDERRDWDALAARAIAAALEGAGQGGLVAGAGAQVEVSVRLTDDVELQRLNRDYRGKDRPTNVLSFPMLAPDELSRWLAAGETDLLLGDLALAHETVVREAEARAITVEDHVTHLLVHGALHLLGHDHLDDATADAMEALETRILAGLGVADPYADGEAAGAAVDERS
jgi:probable rRNA maturation factor